MSKRDWTTCSKYDDHESQGNLEGKGGGGRPTQPFNEHGNFMCISYSYELQKYEGSGYHLSWDLLTIASFMSHEKRASHQKKVTI